MPNYIPCVAESAMTETERHAGAEIEVTAEMIAAAKRFVWERDPPEELNLEQRAIYFVNLYRVMELMRRKQTNEAHSLLSGAP
jgi:hypothetical protein